MGDPSDLSQPLDSARAAESYELLRPRLEALPAADVINLWLSAVDASRQALALAQRATEPARLQRLKGLGTEFDAQVIADLNHAAWALWHAQARYADADATSTTAQIPKDVADESAEVRMRMFRILDYNIGHSPDVAAILASIRSGGGHPDTASDLHRLADLWGAHEAVLAKDGNHYDPKLGPRARQLSATILSELAASETALASHWADRRARCFTLLSRWYADVYLTCAWLHRFEPEQAGLFTPLTNLAPRPPKKA